MGSKKFFLDFIRFSKYFHKFNIYIDIIFALLGSLSHSVFALKNNIDLM